MPSEQKIKESTKQAVLKILKAVATAPAQVLFYGSTLLAIASIGGEPLTGILATLGTSVGYNIIANMLERVARGENVSDDDIRETIEEAIQNSGIDKLATSNELQHSIAHIFRQIDLIKYLVQKGEFEIASILEEQFSKCDLIFDEFRSDFSEIKTKLDSLATREQSEMILKQIEKIGPLHRTNLQTKLIDKEIEKNIEIIKKTRFFTEFDRESFITNFAKQLSNGGDLVDGSSDLRSKALAWCARIQIVTDRINKAEEYLDLAKDLGTNLESILAQAFIISQKGALEGALSILGDTDFPESRSAALMIKANHKGPQEAINWLQKTGTTWDELDSDGKYQLIVYQTQLGNWDTAWKAVEEITESDLQATPILNHLVAILNLLKAVPEELRSTIFIQLPLIIAGFRFVSNKKGIAARREALKYFLKATQVTLELNCPRAAIIDDEYALWLQLSDPEEYTNGQARLNELLRDPKTRLRKINFAVQFGIKVDPDFIGQEIDREIALHGKVTENAAIARFALVFIQRSAIDLANYIIKYKTELEQFIDNKSLGFLEVEVFSNAGMTEKAKASRDLLMTEQLSETDQTYLQTIIARNGDVNPIETLMTSFNKTKSIKDLGILVDELQKRNDWERLCQYGLTLFEQTHNFQDAEIFVTALYNTQKFSILVKFIKENSEYLSQSPQIHILYCWALFYEGSFIEAQNQIEKLTEDQENWNYRSLKINLSIALGDWNSITRTIENEWEARDRRNAKELIEIAQLALHINSPRTKEILHIAAEKGADDPNALVSAILLAFQGNWEHDSVVYSWFEQAAALSGEDGPIKKVSVKDFANLEPDLEQKKAKKWEEFTKAEIPISIASHFVNKSLFDLTLVPALINYDEKDPRRRSGIPSFSGNRQSICVDTEIIAGFDITSLVTLNLLGLLNKTLDCFVQIYIPHSTLILLFEEKQRAFFRQPSQVTKAQQIQSLIATEVLKKIVPSIAADSELSDLIGNDLASLIAEAEYTRDDDHNQRLVVRSFPVHQVSSLSMDEADLESHEKVLCNCTSIVNKLRVNGQITAEEEKKAIAYLRLNDKPWPNQPEIENGAILYLDALSITYFYELNLFEQLQSAGFEIFVSPQYITEMNGLISYEKISEHVKDAIEQIRSIITPQIEIGKIRTGRRNNFSRSEYISSAETSTADLYILAEDCEAIIVDDRYFNQHPFIELNGKKSRVFTTLDILDTLVEKKQITIEEYEESRTKLRRCGYLFLPVKTDELIHHINKPGRLIENAELKAIRENFLFARMSSWLQLPNEAYWLESAIQSYIQAIKYLWKSNNDLSIIKASTDWILEMLDMRGWAHRSLPENRHNLIFFGRIANALLLLFPLQDVSSQIQEEYWNWIEERLLKPISEQYPDLYSWMIEVYKKQLSEFTEKYLNQGISKQ